MNFISTTDMDTDVSICNVKNKENGEELTVYTEWSDLKIKIVIINADNIFKGEALKHNFSRNAKTFEKSISEFLKETQDILAGKINDIDFVLQNEKFFWKRNKWLLGEIVIKPLSEISHASSLLLNILNKFSQNLKHLKETKEKHKSDENIICELRDCNSDLVKKKEQSDSEWCKRTILIVNSKKEKIRSLKEKLETYKSEKDPIFDADTENSEGEENITVNSDIRHKKNPKLEIHSEKIRKKITRDISVQTEELESTTFIAISETRQRCKRKFFDGDEKSTKKKKCDVCIQTEHVESPMEEKEIPSTSKSLQMSSNIGEDEETPDMLTDESECEVELKFEDDKNQNTETQETLLTREESSEELF